MRYIPVVSRYLESTSTKANGITEDLSTLPHSAQALHSDYMPS
jgi:hypothetical protein